MKRRSAIAVMIVAATFAATRVLAAAPYPSHTVRLLCWTSAGARLRDVRNGMSIPPALTLRTVLDAVPRPRWWFDLLTTEPLVFASLASSGGTPAELIDRVFDPAITMADLEWLREQWPGALVAKGVQSVADAKRVVEAGDGLLVE